MIWIGGRLRNRLVEWRMQAVNFRRAAAFGWTGRLAGFWQDCGPVL